MADTPRKIAFLTGTRAEFGKLKSLMFAVAEDLAYELHVFVTGMHMLRRYGYTCLEVEKCNFPNVFKYINQNNADTMDAVLGKTIMGLSDYVKEVSPDLIVVHGDRPEALAGAIVGALTNTLVAHVEGGEISGTIDELVRHAVSKMSHLHFVSNSHAKLRLMQLGEREDTIHVIGSPDLDVMKSASLPSLEEVKSHYEIPFEGDYGILMFHPVTTEVDELEGQIANVVEAVRESDRQYVVIYPNNDLGSDTIIRAYRQFQNQQDFRVFPSMRFEYFLSLLKNASFMIGNSSSGIMEAPFYGVPAIDIGTRQNNRAKVGTVVNVAPETKAITDAISNIDGIERAPTAMFGEGGSDRKFKAVLDGPDFWQQDVQKQFVDLLAVSGEQE